MENKEEGKLATMTVDEVTSHILKHMSAEEAVKKLIPGVVKSYEGMKLKYDDPEIQMVHPLMIIALACMDLGWAIIVEKPDEREDQNIRGVIVGNSEYINIIGKKLNAEDERSTDVSK